MSVIGFELANPVIVDYQKLKSENVQELFPRLLEAFGNKPDCLGIILVDMHSVPEYPESRRTLLSYASYLAALPHKELQKLENIHAKYIVGWSHGKERLKSGAVDTRKGMEQICPMWNYSELTYSGSYYVNPMHDQAVASEDLKERFPEYTDPNLWPSEDVLPGFRKAFEDLARLILRVGALLAKVSISVTSYIRPG